MVATRGSRRKSAPAAAAASSGSEPAAAAVASSSGRGDAAAAAPVDYVALYREAARQERQKEQSNIVRRTWGQIKLLYHRQSITWAWYMLETWETLLWMSFLLLITYFVLSACFLKPNSICRSTLDTAFGNLAEQGAKLLAYKRAPQ